MKKKNIIIWGVVILAIILIVTGAFVFTSNKNELPKPEVTSGLRGEFGIDKNINEKTIDDYLGRDDSVYRDMRMLKDPGNTRQLEEIVIYLGL